MTTGDPQENHSSSELPALAAGRIAGKDRGRPLGGLRDVEVKISLELGRTEITLDEALALGPRSLLAVDRLADEPVDVRVNGRLFGRGKLVMVGDSYGIQLTELVEGEGAGGTD